MPTEILVKWCGFFAERDRFDLHCVNVTHCTVNLKQKNILDSALDPLDDEAIQRLRLVCWQDIDPTNPQLELLREKIVRIGHRQLRIKICASISSLRTLLGYLSDAFMNNRHFTLDVSGSRLNQHDDDVLWGPCISNFIQLNPTLCCLNLGKVKSIPENINDTIIHHRHLKELQLAHSRSPDTNHHDLYRAAANIIARGNMRCLNVRFDLVDGGVPECYQAVLKGGMSRLQVLDIGLNDTFVDANPAVSQKVQHQMYRILCNDLSVKHIVESNHRLYCFMSEARIPDAKLRRILLINKANSNEVMWKIRQKCFLCVRTMEEWMANLGNDFNDEYANVKWLNKKLHVIQWLTRPDGSNGQKSLTWVYKFLLLHHTHLLSYHTTRT